MRNLTRDERLILQEAARIKRKLQESAGSYWNNSGKYQREAEKLDKLVPDYGPAETAKGELWRAARNIYYDFNNNGFGNNWSGPADLLLKNINFPDQVHWALNEHKHGKPAKKWAKLELLMEEFINVVIGFLRDFDPSIPNTIGDMWDHQTYVFSAGHEDFEDDLDEW